MLDLAFSGGGSRQTTFHRGIIRALNELGLIWSVDVVFAVSGGSIFGPAWMRGLVAAETTAAFLDATRGKTIPALFGMRADTIALLERHAACQIHPRRALYVGFEAVAEENETPTTVGQHAPS